jgi:glycosyltransferase involved in cell wall biosynthesis
MRSFAILHVASLFGGGVDRCVRDIVRGAGGSHLIWHAADGIDVLEDPQSRRFHRLDPKTLPARGAELAEWLRAQRVGIVHLHSLARAPRERAAWAREMLGVGAIATLHDILFLREDAFDASDPLDPDPQWLAQTGTALRACGAITAPSSWLAGLAQRHIPGIAVTVVPNGSPRHSGTTPRGPRAAFAGQRPPRVVALLGAIGPHKGSDILDDIARRLEDTDIALVVIGYLDRQLFPGWRIPGRLFVHGAYAESDAAALLRGYAANLVLFPNTVPESFSYALSDAWTAGVPVLAAAQGAQAERIERHGGGWLLGAKFDAQEAAATIRALVGGHRESERARVQSLLSRPDGERVPSLEAMTRSLNALYERFGIDPAAPESAEAGSIEALVATNLDGTLFRQELVRLCDEYSQALADAQRTRSEAKAWTAKLETDVRQVQDELRNATEEMRRQGQEIVQLRVQKDAFDLLPQVVRKLLLKRILNARR